MPIVFVNVVDPVGAGYVESLARPGGNVTGFTPFEYGLSGKWLELLKEVAPSVRRAAVLRDPAVASGVGQYAIIQAVAPSLGVELRPIDVRDPGEIERGVVAFAREPNGGLIIAAGSISVSSSRSDHHACRPPPIARRVSFPLISPTAAALIVLRPRSRSIRTGAPPAMSTASSRARSRPTYLSSSRPNLSWLSISRPPRRSASTFPPMLLARADEVIE